MVGVSILKLLGLENSKTVTPLQLAAFSLRREIFRVVGVSILKLLGLENSKTVTPSQVAAFFLTNSPTRVILKGKGGGSFHFEAFGPRKLQNGDYLAGGCLLMRKFTQKDDSQAEGWWESPF